MKIAAILLFLCSFLVTVVDSVACSDHYYSTTSDFKISLNDVKGAKNIADFGNADFCYSCTHTCSGKVVLLSDLADVSACFYDASPENHFYHNNLLLTVMLISFERPPSIS